MNLYKSLTKRSIFKDLFLCFFSALLLILAFPKTDSWILAWVGLIPLLFALDGKKPLEAFKTGYVCGLLFFSGTLYWFFHVTAWFTYVAMLGIILLLLYLALYFGLFGLSYSFFKNKKPLFKLFLLPSTWVICEFLRACLFSGFDWVSLGHSQYRNLTVIQIADITGVFGISFLIVMVNFVLKVFIQEKCIERSRSPLTRQLPLLSIITLSLLIVTLGYGKIRLSPSKPSSQISIAVIQGNIAQELKWQEDRWPMIMKKYMALTEQVASEQPSLINTGRQERPQLIVWPETSFPGILGKNNDYFTELKEFVDRLNVPLLFGSVSKEGEAYYNSAILLSRDGQVAAKYHKVHLVPFGEYIPFRSFFPFLSDLVPIADFKAGGRYTLFSVLPEGEKDKEADKFSVLICFEDTVSALSRRFVNNGSQLLINITNDAWFKDTKAPFMHLQSSVFRTVENRRSLVRAANTGVSCFIDRYGRIINQVQGKQQAFLPLKGPDEAGHMPTSAEKEIGKMTYVSGHAIETVQFNNEKTFYTKFGDVFTICCFGCILLAILKRH